ncbi:FAD-binding protein, partial [Chloroflexota bacterium]
RVLVEYISQNKEWVESLGGKIELIRSGGEHDVPGRESIEIYQFKGKGPKLMQFLEHQVELRGIQVMYDTTANRLLTNLKGEVIGVRACSSGGKDVNIKALRAVIMTLGGFEFNEEMKLNYLKVYPTYFAGSPANTGDGIKMVQDVGASLWHMNCCAASFVLKFPDFPVALGPNFRGSRGYTKWSRGAVEGNPCGYIIVDKYGKRYTNEEFRRHTVYYELASYDSQRLEHPRVPSYWIFDRRRIEMSPLPLMWYGPMIFHLYKWSEDNQEEIKRGWIIQGKDAKELALNLNMAPATLKKTIESYNEYCLQKDDPEFHRPQQHLAPLNDPPFFAVKVWPGSANTQGGPHRNDRAQILNADSEPIPRLYAAGEFGSVYGMLYPAGGGNIAECIAFGRIAGENAAKEPPSTE